MSYFGVKFEPLFQTTPENTSPPKNTQKRDTQTVINLEPRLIITCGSDTSCKSPGSYRTEIDLRICRGAEFLEITHGFYIYLL